MAVDKVIVTNVAALQRKYGPRFKEVKAAVTALIAADRARGLRTALLAIDSPADMARVGGKAVTRASDEKGAKAAVDAVCRHHTPDYVLLLGAPDVIPHILLTNPMGHGEDGDDDEHVPSDLPYACEAAFSRNPKDFVGPTRVVGRLPDVMKATEPGYLLTLLKTAATYASRSRSSYSGHFAISARVWEKSTVESVGNLFGTGAQVLTSPAGGPNWTKKQLTPRLHFINCHGADLSPLFFGEGPKGKFFDAHSAAHLSTRVTAGSVIAAECCYGAQQYDPSETEGQAGISTTYLGAGAYGFFGSTTIAYGPSEGQGQADLICQYFMEVVMKGGSLGRAALEARQRFVAQFSHVDPSDLKTAVQFVLLGDPSLQPIAPTAHAFSRSKTVQRALATGTLQPEARRFRRERLVRTGSNLAHTVGATVQTDQRVPARVRAFLAKAARESGLRKARITSHRVVFPSGPVTPEIGRLRPSQRGRAVYVMLGERAPGGAVTAVIATVEGARIVHVRRVHSR